MCPNGRGVSQGRCFDLSVENALVRHFVSELTMLSLIRVLRTIVVVDADQGAGEGEDLAKSREDGGIDDTRGRYEEGSGDEGHAEEDKGSGKEELVTHDEKKTLSLTLDTYS